jgi:hypothetical protein
MTVSGSVLPIGKDESGTEILMDTRTGGVIVTPVDPLIEPDVAVIVAAPCASDVSSPPALTVATVVAEEDQFTELSVCLLASLNVPIAVSVCVEPKGRDGEEGVMEMDCSDGCTVVPPVLPPPPQLLNPAIISPAIAAANRRTDTLLFRATAVSSCVFWPKSARIVSFGTQAGKRKFRSFGNRNSRAASAFFCSARPSTRSGQAPRLLHPG